MARSMIRATVAAALLLGPAAEANAQGLTGTWNVEMGEWKSEGSVAVVVQGASSGELVVTTAGDAALAILRVPLGEGSFRADTLRGEILNGRMAVRGSRQLTTYSSGGTTGSERQESTIEIEADFDEQDLKGVMRMTLGGTVTVSAPIRGRRAAAEAEDTAAAARTGADSLE